jgi:RNA polymerase subunit RPABC4/transcription elongation factor Spt4
MSDYSQKVSGSFNERMRLIRLRRKKENLRFWSEFRIIPGWLIGTVVFLFLVAQVIAISVNHWNLRHNGSVFAPDLVDFPVLEALALAGAVTGISLVAASYIFLIAYVNRDAKRRGMHSALWTLMALLLSWPFPFLGVIIYFLVREPLPYPCPRCSTAVGARFNFCPNCKCNLHPSCSQCKREIAESDKFCPYCGNDLKTAPGTEAAVQSSI